MTNLFIGIMSGTSMDGIDAVIFDTANNSVLNNISITFPNDLYHSLTELIEHPHISLAKLGYLDIALAELYSLAVDKLLNKAELLSSEIMAIGCHGQTIYHQPEGDYRFSMQLGSGSYLAEKTSITTITDFRNRDMAAGGQGAPLVPAFHQAVFKDSKKSRLVINIGGISNCSWIPLNGDTTGFDIGPGNTLMDCWISRHQNEQYDNNGDWAASGTLSNSLVTEILNDEYFQKAAPKSTGREYFNLNWLDNILSHHPNLTQADVQASLLAVTARSISDVINMLNPDEVFICGGGVMNKQLMKSLDHLSNVAISNTKKIGISPELVEASAFAWLAKQCIHHQTGTLEKVTGAKHPVISGAIYVA